MFTFDAYSKYVLDLHDCGAVKRDTRGGFRVDAFRVFPEAG